jgi:phosphoglycolate phosphatase
LPDKLNRLYSDEHYVLRSTIHKTLARGEVKPNQRVLLQIIKETGARIDECVYVGDSLMKDIFMAQKAGVKDVWARYGVAQSREEYELLRRVTHWTLEDVEAEKKLMPEQVNPTHTLHESFAELLDVFKFSAFNKRTFRESSRASGR